MDKKKQIDEMAKHCPCYDEGKCYFDDETTEKCDMLCQYGTYAEAIYNAGYRKQSEGEWVEQVRVSKKVKLLLINYKCNLCGVYLATQSNYCPNCGAKMRKEDEGK